MGEVPFQELLQGGHLRTEPVPELFFKDRVEGALIGDDILLVHLDVLGLTGNAQECAHFFEGSQVVRMQIVVGQEQQLFFWKPTEKLLDLL